MTRARGIAAVAIALAALSFPACAYAEPVSQLHPTNYVNDFAHVLSPKTTTSLNDIAQQVDQKAKAQIAVVTINSLDGRDIESYAVDLFKQWGIGNKSTNRGVLILIAVKDHRYRTEVGYGLEPILPDGKVGGFWREVVPLLKQSDYDQALKLNTERVASVIAEDAGVQLTGASSGFGERAPPRRSSPGISLGGVVILIILVIIILATPLRGILFWWLLMGGGGRGGGWGGGGFGGGGGGGGGFGGFGGGSSGGGGASGSW
ncbi:MAG: hypothetical protein JWN74_3385 [Acidobacteriaceae bacterium]|nr:hypothetical protein [Acidobacteriaceae bacterium]